ncbi:sigma-54-dependent Fis family transcriptional regulator, partial [Desulfovibrio desulfuricans]|nr:sigma-54-dependent Fis family transcriptional regulator [Desulfovibrio desulfuricans]
YPMIESAVEAMRLGAFHYQAKPYSLEEARILVARALEKRRLRQQVAQMRAQLEASGSVPEMVGMSPAMCGLRQALMCLAPTAVAVLLQGETGTG